MNRLDLPPVWLAGLAAAAWLWAGAVDLLVAPGWLRALGWLLMAAAAGLVVWAALTMRRADTPIEPRREARALVTSGPFAWSRHPIYRALIGALSGLVLASGELTGLLLVPLYGVILLRRFIEPEERALEARFGEAFRDWAARTRRL